MEQVLLENYLEKRKIREEKKKKIQKNYLLPVP